MIRRDRFPCDPLKALALVGALAACGGSGRINEQRLITAAAAAGCAVIPATEQWEYMGTAIEPGEEGEFDHCLWGGFGGSPLRVGNEIFLYYQGATGYSEVQQSVSFRSIGLAVSPDGTTFRKDPASPVLEWRPTMGEEEGAASVAVALGPENEIIAFYGANTMSGATSVNADGRWASSKDGRVFHDQGIALDHTDPAVFAAGDELFPVIAFHHRERWFVYYLPNGRPRGRLGVAWGSAPNALRDAAAVKVRGEPVFAWGMQSAVHLCDDVYALFLNRVNDRTISVYLTDVRAPEVVTEPVARYRFPGRETEPELIQGAVLLDRDAGYWYLYYRTTDRSRYDVRRAPLVVR